MAIPILDTDNRDDSTTWLWINQREYVEVNPKELMENMIENLPEPINNLFAERFASLMKDLDKAVDEIADAYIKGGE
jgi:hypothetical protein